MTPSPAHGHHQTRETKRYHPNRPPEKRRRSATMCPHGGSCRVGLSSLCFASFFVAWWGAGPSSAVWIRVNLLASFHLFPCSGSSFPPGLQHLLMTDKALFAIAPAPHTQTSQASPLVHFHHLYTYAPTPPTTEAARGGGALCCTVSPPSFSSPPPLLLGVTAG